MTAKRIPDFVTVGKPVLYEGKKRIVLDYSWTCPCAIGNTKHHPSADLIMLKLKDVGDVPSSKVLSAK